MAALGIVGYHSGARGHDVFYAALVFFLMASPFMEVRYNFARSRSTGQLAKLFLIPWVFWTFVYAAFNLVRGKPLWAPDLDALSGLLYGTSAHLWFMPFMFGVLLLIRTAKQKLAPDAMLWGSLAICTTLLLASPAIRPWAMSLDPPLAQWIHASPAIFAGVVLGLAGSVHNGRLGLLVLAGVLATTASYGIRGISLSYPLGALMLFAATASPRLFARVNIEQFSSCMLGVYLVHMFWLSLVRPLTNRIDLAGVIVAFLAAFISVWLARRYVRASRLVLG